MYYINSAASGDETELTPTAKAKTAEITSFAFDTNEVKDSTRKPA